MRAEGGALEPVVFDWLLRGFFVLALVVFALLLLITVPYGRHNEKRRPGWGPQIGSLFGWLLMEIPASVVPVYFLCIGARRDAVLWVFFAIWQVHYFNRAFVFPFRRRGGAKTMPLVISLSGLLFNGLNAYLNWRFLTTLGPAYPLSWLGDPRFVVGLAIFLLGFGINQHADWVLFNLRAPGEAGYKIPYGGLYRLVSCPNYLGELLEWIGWAVLTYSLPGLAFAGWTFANLVPRALAHHRDYHRRFVDYPADRRAILPFLL